MIALLFSSNSSLGIKIPINTFFAGVPLTCKCIFLSTTTKKHKGNKTEQNRITHIYSFKKELATMYTILLHATDAKMAEPFLALEKFTHKWKSHT